MITRLILLLLAASTVCASPNRAGLKAAWYGVYARGGAQELWTPADLGTNTVAWYDAMDSGTVELTGGTDVSRWLDKSHYAAHASSAAGSRPTYNSASTQIVFNAAISSRFRTPTNTYNSVSGYTAFMVAQTYSNATAVSYFLADRVGTSSRLPIYFDVVTSKMRTLAFLQGTTTFSTALDPVEFVISDGLTLFSAQADTSPLVSLWRNGTLAASVAGQSAYSTNASQLSIGANHVNLQPVHGAINEILLSYGPLTTGHRQKTEGYLAHKWGLTANLPSGHPWKNTPPTK